MKVILLQDIPRVGRKHEVLQVPNGHAQNYLIPRRLAVPATVQNLKRQSEKQAHSDAKRAMTESAFTQFLENVGTTPVTITVSANEHGHLFKGLHVGDIAQTFSDTAGITLSASAITLARPIKEVGTYPITVALGNQQGTVVLMVKGK